MTQDRQSGEGNERERALLECDERWLLVQRIVASEGLQRAAQLRQILLYAAKSAILQPNEVLGEFEVASKILGRRPDFNPATDNIVRAQFSNLRHKLAHYFESEGRNEPLVLTIPKGNYVPVFAPAQVRTPVPRISEPVQSEPDNADKEIAHSSSRETLQRRHSWMNWALGVALLLNLVFAVLILILLRRPYSQAPNDQSAALTNPFVLFLGRVAGDVTIVLPDTSLAIIQQRLRDEISLSDYTSNDFPQRQLANVRDPAMRDFVSDLGRYRTTSANEAMIGIDFLETLRKVGVNTTIRYARDIHVVDLNRGNCILIGGPHSDPWVSLFNDQVNFQHLDDLTTNIGYFVNHHPAPGEAAIYLNVYSSRSTGYVDVTLTQNPSHTGYVLMINGADMQENESAARFLLHGTLPPEMASVLSRKDIRSFEFFLRGRHTNGETDDSFELIAIRPR